MQGEHSKRSSAMHIDSDRILIDNLGAATLAPQQNAACPAPYVPRETLEEVRSALRRFVRAARLSRLSDGHKSVECELAVQIADAEEVLQKTARSAA